MANMDKTAEQEEFLPNSNGIKHQQADRLTKAEICLDTQEKGPSNLELGTRTVMTFLQNVTVGLGVIILGPTLVSMEILHNTDTAGISWAFIGLRIGGILGAFLGFLISGKIKPELPNMLCCLFTTIGMMIAPFTGQLIGFILLITMMGIGVGYNDGACPFYIMNLWKDRKFRNSVMHLLNVFLAASQIVAPLVIRHFLVDNEKDISMSGFCVSNQSTIDVHHVNGINITMLPNETVVYKNRASLPDGVQDVSFSRFAYVALGSICAFVTVFMAFVFIIFKDYRRVFIDKNTSSNETTNVIDKKKKTPKVILLLFGIFMFLFNWIEATPGAYFSTFAVKGLCWDMKTGSDVTMVYQILNTFGRILAVPLSHFLHARTMLCICFVLNIIAWSIGFVIPVFNEMLWVTAAVGGLGLSTMFINLLLWMSDFTVVSGRLTSFGIFFQYIGGIVSPIAIGNLFEEYGHMYVIYLPFCAVILQTIIFISMICVVRVHRLVEKHKGPPIEVNV